MAIPSALANGVLQINLLVGQFVSSQETGAISWLYGADRLYQLPLGVVGIAIGIVLLPELSRRIASNDESGAHSAFNNAFTTSMALTIPATVALFIVPLPLISALFQHGQTTSTDAVAMALATSIYALGLPAFVLQKVYQPIYFARGDTKTPFRFAVHIDDRKFINCIWLNAILRMDCCTNCNHRFCLGYDNLTFCRYQKIWS